MGDLPTLKRIRASLKARLTSFIKFIDRDSTQGEMNEPTRAEIELRIENAKNIHTQYQETQLKIESLLDAITEEEINYRETNLRALEALEQPVEHWDALLKYILLKKFNSESVKEWEKANNGTSVNNHVKFRHNSTKALVSTKSSFLSCPLCNQQHKLVHCSQFHSLDIPARINKVRRFKLCLNCLHSGHQQATCKYGECKKCNQKHYTLFHEFIENPLNPLSQFNDQVVASQSSPQTLSNTSQNQQILLSTVVVQVRNHLGVAHNCRALLDSGAQSNFITSSLVDLLGISREQVNISVVGIAHVSSEINHKCNIVINSLQSIYSFPLECLIIPQICGQLPVCQIDASSLPIPANIRLSDPNFHTPSEVNILISASIFWDLLCVGQVKLGPEKPILQKTRLGWIISGPLINTRVNSQQSTICGLSHNIETDGLSRFWEIEECSGTKHQSTEELLCEEHFKSTFRRNLDGRFIVSIPFKLQVDSLGESRSIAQRRFYSLEKRLLNDPLMKEQYVAFMEQYLSLGHMSRVTDCTLPVHSYYFPHHGAMKQDSLTTKLRVVFDGSCPSSSGHSLNDLQMRNHPKDPLHSYELNTVTYGSTSSSYLATRSLYQLSLEHSYTFPQASKIIAEDFYVDDLLTGSDSLEDLILNCKQVSEILSKGCFPLRKWTSNNSSFLKSIQESILLDTSFLFGANENTKTLGLQWCPSLDSLSYSIDSNVTPKIITKRSILSGIAQIFDPLGLLSPSIIKVKILMQLLWLEKLDWDEGVPLHIQSEWLSFRDQLHELNKLQIQRNVVLPNFVLIEMHGFCDASEVAYGAAIYIRSVDKKEHFKLCHAGPQHLLAHVREKYWPLHGKSLARRTVRECLRCFRFNPDQVNPIMGDLPQSRVTPSFPFAITGVDYAGPFALRTSRHRGASSYKGYISLFVCLSTKAIHLEVVTDLSTEAFMAAIKRFIARRGKPCQMMSDNGTTFVGANNSLLELGKFLKTNGNKFPDMCAKSDINWKFIPAHSPHFGGLWEAGVKSVKANLKRVMTDTKLDYERFVTLLTQIEGVLNSRPLSALSSNPSDLLPLTPAHFLIGRAMDSVPEINLSNSSITSLSRFQQLQQLRHHFWKRWCLEYISELQERKKWKANQSKIQTDTLVLIKERNLPPLNWCLGRVEVLHPGVDGVTRVVTIRTSKGLIKRAVTNICPLPLPSDQSEGAITP
ncbi:uncharacterized protein [Diabrotica undecimpunctata]|uniref:uncharacterized protein n=1 Tax=Diabrotica undecimpunctata TaxID=50387 RepID=UPI003B6373AA